LANKYLKKAANDLKIAQSELATNDPVYDMICFHFQQFTEKCLKAFLIFNKIEIIKTHNIPYLLKQCFEIDKNFETFIDSNLIKLNSCGVDIRYDNLDEVDKGFIDEVYPVIIEFKEFIYSKVKLNTLFSN
jgi:HEPN domain-containing protein